MPYVTNQGVRIYYEVVGERPPLMLLHGGLSNHKAWHQTVYFETLKKEYQLIMIDLRGHGASDKPHDSKAYELKTLVRDFTSVLDDLKVEKAHYLGYARATEWSSRIRSGKVCARAFQFFHHRRCTPILA